MLVPPTMEQPQYNMFCREKVEGEYRDLYRRFGLGTTIWSPLASGILTGKYSDGIPSGSRLTLAGYEWLKSKVESNRGREQIQQARQLAEVAGDLATSLPKLALAWCLKCPAVSTVILGASRPEQLEENLAAIEVLPLLDDAGVIERIEQILGNKPKPPEDFRA